MKENKLGSAIGTMLIYPTFSTFKKIIVE